MVVDGFRTFHVFVTGVFNLPKLNRGGLWVRVKFHHTATGSKCYYVAVYTFLCLVVFFLSSLKIAMESLKKSTVIATALVWASFSVLDLASGCGGCPGRSRSCKYTVMCSESVLDGICILNVEVRVPPSLVSANQR